MTWQEAGKRGGCVLCWQFNIRETKWKVVILSVNLLWRVMWIGRQITAICWTLKLRNRLVASSFCRGSCCSGWVSFISVPSCLYLVFSVPLRGLALPSVSTAVSFLQRLWSFGRHPLVEVWLSAFTFTTPHSFHHLQTSTLFHSTTSRLPTFGHFWFLCTILILDPFKVTIP